MYKLTVTLVLLLISIIMMHDTSGQSVSETEAARVVAGFLRERSIETHPLKGLHYYLIEKSDTPVIHLFRFETGFVLVSANKSCYPVLAYSLRSTFQSASVVPSVKFWIDMYASQILTNIQHSKKPPAHIAEAWIAYNDSNGSYSNKFNIIEPMLNTTWNQGCYYNSALPLEPEGPCGHLYTGCVATALAQILNYYHYPKQGSGNHSLSTPYGTVEANFENTTYEWADMQLNLQEENPVVAELMLHCAVAVNSQFFPYGTGAYDIDARHALVNYFGYHPGAQFRLRHNYSGDWNALIISELDSGRPVIYGGLEQATGAGHTFIIDGFQEPAFFHINWGWGGQYNGYFYLDSLIAGNYHFDYFHDAITGIRPDIPASQSLYPPENLQAEVDLRTVSLSWTQPGFTSSLELIGYNVFRNQQLLNESIVTGLQLTDEDVPPGDHTYHVQSVFIGGGNGPLATTQTYVSGFHETGERNMKLFPNPASGKITIELQEHLPDRSSVTVFDITGIPVAPSDYEQVNGSTLQINLSNCSPGLYFIYLEVGTETQVHKIVLY
ncbi:MAG: thiol protease/hemagglutinin PrtT [Bacteroidales bacterium]